MILLSDYVIQCIVHSCGSRLLQFIAAVQAVKAAASTFMHVPHDGHGFTDLDCKLMKNG